MRVAPSVEEVEAITAVEKAVGGHLRSLEWRLDHLYRIVDEDGRDTRFRMNDEQREFIRNLHTRNVIIKARQLGISTLVQMLQLDQALFNSDHTGVTISDTVPNAGKLMGKVEYALKRLEPALLDALPIKAREAKSNIEWEHGSALQISTSSRGGTVQLLHVSELAKIARTAPERAEEIVTGAFESVPIDGIIIVESTTKGAFGALYDLAWPAYLAQQAGEPQTRLDWRVHFFPWFRKGAYTLFEGEAEQVVIDDKAKAYFRDLEARLGITLTLGQRAWYVKKKAEKGRAMLAEYPATIKEAFEAVVEGAIFGLEMALVREAGRITDVPIDREQRMHTFWDFGTSNRTVVWCMQRINLQNRWVRYFQADGTGLGAMWRTLEAWRKQNGEFQWGTHHLPHDANTERLGEGVDTYERILVNAGMRDQIVVPRVAFKSIAIDLVRQKLPVDNWFDRSGCPDGIKAFDGYQYAWNPKLETWSTEPLPNWAAHGCDAWMQYAQGFDPYTDKRDRSLRNFVAKKRRAL